MSGDDDDDGGDDRLVLDTQLVARIWLPLLLMLMLSSNIKRPIIHMDYGVVAVVDSRT